MFFSVLANPRELRPGQLKRQFAAAVESGWATRPTVCPWARKPRTNASTIRSIPPYPRGGTGSSGSAVRRIRRSRHGVGDISVTTFGTALCGNQDPDGNSRTAWVAVRDISQSYHAFWETRLPPLGCLTAFPKFLLSNPLSYLYGLQISNFGFRRYFSPSWHLFDVGKDAFCTIAHPSCWRNNCSYVKILLSDRIYYFCQLQTSFIVPKKFMY